MPWFSILKGLLSLVGHVAKIMADKQLLQAGEYKAIAEYNEAALDKITKADAARRSVPTDGVPDDPNDRDND